MLQTFHKYNTEGKFLIINEFFKNQNLVANIISNDEIYPNVLKFIQIFFQIINKIKMKLIFTVFQF